jgi:hypothetical protein
MTRAFSSCYPRRRAAWASICKSKPVGVVLVSTAIVVYVIWQLFAMGCVLERCELLKRHFPSPHTGLGRPV